MFFGLLIRRLRSKSCHEEQGRLGRLANEAPDVKRSLFLLPLVLLVWLAVQLSSDLRRPQQFQARQVLRVGANFAASVSTYVDTFDKLIDQSNGRIEELNSSAAKQNKFKNVLSWLSISLTVLVTLLAAIGGVNPQENRTEPGAKRSRLVVAIAIIAALASGSQLFTDKLDKDTKANVSAAIELSNTTGLSRVAFLRAKGPEDAAKVISDLQQALLKTAI